MATLENNFTFINCQRYGLKTSKLVEECKDIVNIEHDLIINSVNFRRVIDLLDSIPCINWGGCAISALSIHRWLVKNKLFNDSDFIFLYRLGDNLFDDNSKRLNSIINEPLWGPAHVILQIGRDFIDSTGICKDIDTIYYRNCNKNITEKQLIDSIKFAPNWNSKFDRSNIYTIEEFLDINLNEIK